MDYGSIATVRTITGLTEEDISDSELSELLNIAQRWFFRDVFARSIKEDITYNRVTENVYGVKYTPIVSPANGFNPSPSELTVEAVNITATTLSGMKRTIAVVALDPWLGLVELAEAPQSVEKLFITYYYAPVPLDTEDINTAVNLLAAHLTTLKLQDPGNITIADLQNNELVVKNSETRFLDTYKAFKSAIIGKARSRAIEK